MKPPIFVVSDGSSVQMFEGIERAEASLEAIDVLNGEFQVFDADGVRLQATAESDESPVVITESSDRPPERERLRLILRDHLRAVLAVRPGLLDASADQLSDARLPELVSEMRLVEERFERRSMASRFRRLFAAIRERLGTH